MTAGVGVGVWAGVGVGVGVGVGDALTTVKVLAMAKDPPCGGSIRKCSGAIEGASKDRSLVTKSRIPDAVWRPGEPDVVLWPPELHVQRT